LFKPELYISKLGFLLDSVHPSATRTGEKGISIKVSKEEGNIFRTMVPVDKGC